MKTYLCGILVYGEGLYSDVWIDFHHKHDSNQVITSTITRCNNMTKHHNLKEGKWQACNELEEK